jgi:ferredoxin
MWVLTVREAESVYTVSVDAERDLLTQMREALPLALRRACRNGVCTVCRCRLVAGEISYGSRQALGLWEQEIRAGFILPCIARPGSDLTLDTLTLELPRRR